MSKILMLNIFGMEKQNAELIHFSNIANELSRLGHSVRIYHVSLKGRPAINSLISQQIVFDEVFISGRSYLLFLTALIKSAHFIKTIRRIKPDVIYVRLGLFSGLYILVIRKYLGKAVNIITEHNGWIGPELKLSGYNPLLVSFGQNIQRASAQSSDRIRAVSSGIKEYLISLGVKDSTIFVAGNGTDTRLFRPMPIRTRYTLGFVGNFAAWQGLDILIEALSLIVKDLPAISLIVAGSGKEDALLRQQITKLGITEHVHLLGNVPYDKVPEIINACRICIAPFKKRGSNSDDKSLSPLKIRDYAACGKPIITSRMPGLQEIEHEKFGILVEPSDIHGLADAIRSLVDNPELCDAMGRNARSYAERHYSWEHPARVISQNISELLLHS